MASADSCNNNPVQPSGFTSNHMTEDLFKDILKGINPEASLVHWRPCKLNTSNSILAKLAAKDDEIKRFVGHVAYIIQYNLPGDQEGVYHSKDVVLKSKPKGDETITMLNNVAKAIGGEYATIWDEFKETIGFGNTDHREIEAFRIRDPSVVSIQPEIFFTWKDEQQEIFVYVMENFKTEEFTHMDTVDDVSEWQTQDIEDALHDISEMHARFLGRKSEIPSELAKWLQLQTKELMKKKMPLWKVALDHNAQCFPNVWDHETKDMMSLALDNVDDVIAVLDAAPRTLVHNDFNVRNACFRPSPSGDKKRLCVYDWELVSFAPPQHDVAEFLSFVLAPGESASTWQYYVMKYRSFLMKELNQISSKRAEEFNEALQADNFLQVFDMSVVEILINRFSLYGLPHTFQPYTFLERVVKSAAGYMKNISYKYLFLGKGI